MAKSRDAFGLVLSGLRERLFEGAIAPGAPVNLSDAAQSFKTSVTPVREAVARLAGEGLLVGTRRLGYARPRLSADELTQAYRFHEALLRIAVHFGGESGSGRSIALEDESAEPLFAAIARSAANPPLEAARTRVALALGPARRAERATFTDLHEEAQALARAYLERDLNALLQGFDAYHRRRIQHARQLTDLQS